MGRKARKARKDPAASPPRPASEFRASFWRRPLAPPLIFAALILVATVEERQFGLISDEQQMLFTSVSMAELGEIGIARGMLFAVHRPAGDAVSPYGMGLSLLQSLPASLAWSWERAFGPGSSQTLFVIPQLALILAAAAASGGLSRLVGASSGGVWVAVLGTAIGSPLWAYGGTNYSEPLQAAMFTGAAFAAASAARENTRRRALQLAFLAGGAAGAAVLAKSLNLAVVPLVLAPLVLDGDGFRSWRDRLGLAAVAASGAILPLAAWFSFEVSRFGAPFAAYGGQNFTHPLLDGLWRLLVGPNKGLFVFFPLLALSLFGVGRLLARPETRGTGLAAGGCLAALLALTATWWAWDGTVGWGPRFLVPAIPLLAAAAGAVASSGRALLAGRLLLIAGVLVTLPAIGLSDSAVTPYISSLPGRILSTREAADYPSYYLAADSNGRTILSREFLAATEAHLNPIRVHLFLLGVRLGGGTVEERRARLDTPPWLAAHPQDVPAIRRVMNSTAATSIRYLETGFAWPRLGAAMSKPQDEKRTAFATAFLSAVADQIFRNIDTGLPERALGLAERLFRQAPYPYSAELNAEALRACGRRQGLASFVSTLPLELQRSPNLRVVQALAARDEGNEPLAKAILGQVAGVLKRPGVTRAVSSPVSEWPRSFHLMTGDNVASRTLERPRFGGS